MKGAEYKARYVFDDIVGLNHIKVEAARLAKLDCPVALVGETGVGKELFAHAIHNASGRTGAFVPVNCAAVPDQLFESEFFGHCRGAFTDAKSDRGGILELSHEGTLLLDELADLPLSFQAKLLRVMEDGVVFRLGSMQPVKVDVRYILASNQSLAELLHDKILRSDFYYRIAGGELIIPPLRERSDEIPALIAHCLNQLDGGRTKRRFDRGARRALGHHDYPGNVRELKRIVELAYLNCRSKTITVDDLPILKQTTNGTQFATLKTARVRYAREVLSKVQDYDKAASILGISKRQLFRIIGRGLK